MIEIWSPKYSTNEVLIAKYKICAGSNFIKFTKAKHLKGMIFELKGADAAKCPKQKNGEIICYRVPMGLLTKVEDKKE